jgi:glycerol-3-phosphate dehydrogenase
LNNTRLETGIMRNLQTEILVIGGGATGTGLVRDLAMRGFKTILVEQNDLATGTTGRYHGLLHSGGRYAVKDPLAAKECIKENKILRQIMPECIEDTGGFFALTPQDDPAYVEAFILGCRNAGIPCEEISISDMLRVEPLLNPSIARCFRVPDASADSFLAADLNAESAREYGSVILRYHPVQRLLTTGDPQQNLDGNSAGRPQSAICGAICRDLVKDEEVRIEADLVVNAAGAWAGKIAATAGIIVQMTPGKGILMAVNHRVVNTVINRCKMPGDGDIIVPAHTVAIIGTTDVKVADPDYFGIEPWEVQLMLDEGEKLIPGFRTFRFLRAWAGVRPLYHEVRPQESEDASGNRDITRAFTLLDHAVRDSVNGLLTITGGKWTTYRKMAEVTADKACEKLGVQRDCRTHTEPLPATARHAKDAPKSARRSLVSGHHHQLGHRLAQIEAQEAYGNLICECELATRDDIAHAILDGNTQTLDDIRRDIRLGMGPCQAGFCTLRAAGMLHYLRNVYRQQTAESGQMLSAGNTNAALHDFLQERWKGVRPVLWGQQLRQERLNELIYLNVLNAGHLPGPEESRLSPGINEQETDQGETRESSSNTPVHRPITPLPFLGKSPRQPEVLVIGAGLAGLTAAWWAAVHGKKVKLISKGWGATHWGSGCIDVLGYYPSDQEKPVVSPAEALDKLMHSQPFHPYALAGIEAIDLAIRSIRELSSQSGYPLHGSCESNWLLPTALGAIRPTCLAPETMIAGDLHARDPMLIVGFEQYLDFYPALVVDNLNAQGVFASGTILDIASLKKRRFLNAMALARLFDKQDFRQEVSQAIKPRLGNAARVGFPAVLGLHRSLEVIKDLQNQLGCEVFEIPGLPPSVPGIRLHNLLVGAIQRGGGQIFDGMQVSGSHGQDRHLQAVLTDASTSQTIHQADTFVLASGGILGGGIATHIPGYTQYPIYETALGLPIQADCERRDWLRQKFLAVEGHPIFNVGLEVNAQFQPMDKDGCLYFDNLYTIGGALGNCDPVRERSLEGIAVVTGWLVAERLLSNANHRQEGISQ